jgi:hypothetical protein
MKMKTLAIFAAAAALAVSARGETFTAEPDALLDYIEATGSQYIDTGVNGTISFSSPNFIAGSVTNTGQQPDEKHLA